MASSMSWVMKITVRLSVSQTCSSSSCICSARLRVERAERLVHQEELGLHQQAARDADALLHAARELVGIVALEAARGRPAR